MCSLWIQLTHLLDVADVRNAWAALCTSGHDEDTVDRNDVQGEEDTDMGAVEDNKREDGVERVNEEPRADNEEERKPIGQVG